MITKSVKEQIVDDLMDAIKEVQTVNGYQYTIKRVERWNQSGNEKVPGPVVILHTGNEAKEVQPNFVTKCTLNIHADCWAIHNTSDYDVSTDEFLNGLAADVEKAIMTDRQRNSKAMATYVTDIDLFEVIEKQTYCGFIMTIEIHYRHRTGQPETQFT